MSVSGRAQEQLQLQLRNLYPRPFVVINVTHHSIRVSFSGSNILEDLNRTHV